MLLPFLHSTFSSKELHLAAVEVEDALALCRYSLSPDGPILEGPLSILFLIRRFNTLRRPSAAAHL